MQSPPAYEGMYLHGILHRIEGDYDNARAWYGDVKDSDMFKAAWGSEDDALKFIGQIEKLRKQREGSLKELEKESQREFDCVADFCEKKFGTEKVEDASEVWVQPEGKHKEMGQGMVTGGEGWRKF